MSITSLVVIMLYDKEHKTKTIEFFFASPSVGTVTQRYFKRHFKSTKDPSRNKILRLVDKFRNEGTVNDLRSTAGRRKLVRTPQTVKKLFSWLIRISSNLSDNSRRKLVHSTQLKSVLYGSEPRNVPQLKEAITRAFREISEEMCGRVIRSVLKRAELCLARKGEHFEHVL